MSCSNFVLQDGAVEGYWGNGHIFNRFPIFFYICFFLSPFSTRMVFKKINAHLILQAKLQQYVNHELPDVQAGFRKNRGTRDEIANLHWIIKKARVPEKYLLLLY